MLGIVFELLNSTSGCSHWPAACSCCFSQIWVLSESCRELCCCAFHGRYDQLCQCSLLAACSVQRAGVFQANINVKYCKFFFFLEGLHPLCVWGQTDCGDSRSQGAGVGSEEHGIRSAAKGIQPEVPDPLHQSIPQQTGMAAITFLLNILQENGALFSSLFFCEGVFCNQT